MPEPNTGTFDALTRLAELATLTHGRMHELHLDALNKRMQMPSSIGIVQAVTESATSWKEVAAQAAELAAKFVTHGADLGFVFAYHGLDLGYLFASKGEAVGPMANRVLFMAVQIGVMADRIGEMADRILFMADKIGEFGDRILYESQLIVYSEQLIISESLLISHAIEQLAVAVNELAAIQSGNDAYFEYRKTIPPQNPYPHIYENMNLMLKNMHEFSLEMLKKQTADRERELKVRELQLKQREQTVSVNACYCPGFGVADAPDVPPGEPGPIPPQPNVP